MGGAGIKGWFKCTSVPLPYQPLDVGPHRSDRKEATCPLAHRLRLSAAPLLRRVPEMQQTGGKRGWAANVGLNGAACTNLDTEQCQACTHKHNPEREQVCRAVTCHLQLGLRGHMPFGVCNRGAVRGGKDLADPSPLGQGYTDQLLLLPHDRTWLSLPCMPRGSIWEPPPP